MSAARRAAEVEQLQRRLLASPETAAVRFCPVLDVLPGAAADSTALLVVDLDGEPVEVHRGRRYTDPTVGDLALVIAAQHVYVALDAVVGAPPEQ